MKVLSNITKKHCLKALLTILIAPLCLVCLWLAMACPPFGSPWWMYPACLAFALTAFLVFFFLMSLIGYVWTGRWDVFLQPEEERK